MRLWRIRIVITLAHPCGFSFEADSLIAHPRIPERITNSRSLPGSSLVRANPNCRARFFSAQ